MDRCTFNPGKTAVNAFEYGPAQIICPDIDLEFRDLAPKISMSETRPAILDAARAVFERVKGRWSPAMVYCWTDYLSGNDDETGILVLPGDRSMTVRPGHSNRFLTHARHTLAGVYTAGRELDEQSARASRDGNFLDAHFIDQIGLAVLEKVEHRLKAVAEKKAEDAGWGVSPFLSPGSVHGWDLAEQTKLAGILPVHAINITLSDSGVFSPFKTISCLIGTGPGYEARQVGTTCRVCSKRGTCRMRQPERRHTGQNP